MTRLAAELRTELRRLDKARHFTPEDHPDVITAAINEVVREVAT